MYLIYLFFFLQRNRRPEFRSGGLAKLLQDAGPVGLFGVRRMNPLQRLRQFRRPVATDRVQINEKVLPIASAEELRAESAW